MQPAKRRESPTSFEARGGAPDTVGPPADGARRRARYGCANRRRPRPRDRTGSRRPRRLRRTSPPQQSWLPATISTGTPASTTSASAATRPKRASRNHRAPLEPELEEVAVHDERTGVLRDVAEKRDDGALDVGAGEAQVGVGEDVAGRLQHARILPVSRSLYKQTMLDDLRDVTNDAAAPRAVTPPGRCHRTTSSSACATPKPIRWVSSITRTISIWCEVGRTDFIRARGMSYADIERSGVGLAVSDLDGAISRRGALRRPDSGTHDSGRGSVAKHHVRLRDHRTRTPTSVW